MPTMALCKRWQFISPPIEVGEFLLIIVKKGTYRRNIKRKKPAQDLNRLFGGMKFL